MGINFSDLEHAFLFVSSAQMLINSAVICKETGEIFYASEYDDENMRQTKALREWCMDNGIKLND